MIEIEDNAAVTSSTPHLQTVRLFCSLMMLMKGEDGEPVSQAHPHTLAS